MAHLAVGFFALGMLALVLSGPHVGRGAADHSGASLSAMIVRLRTVADRDTVTARIAAEQPNRALGGHRRAAFDQSPHGRGHSRTDGRNCCCPP